MKTALILISCIIYSVAKSQPPVIDSMLIDELQGTLSIYGDFGGNMGKVWCDSIELNVKNWSAFQVSVNIPDSGKGSYGPVTVGSRGYLSNERMLSKWVGRGRQIDWDYGSSSGSFHDFTYLDFSFRSDLHSMLINHSLQSRSMSLMLGSTMQLSVDEFYKYEEIWRNGATIVPLFKHGSTFDSGFVGSASVSFSQGLFGVKGDGVGFIVTEKRLEIVNGVYTTYTKDEKKSGHFRCQCNFDSLFNIINMDGCQSSVILAAPPDKAFALSHIPSIIAPQNGQSNLGTVGLVLSWDSLKLMDKYQVQLSTDSIVRPGNAQDPQFNSFIVDTLVNIPSCRLQQVDKNAKYYWRVRGLNSEGMTRWTEVRSFTTGEHANVNQSPFITDLYTSSNEIRFTLLQDTDIEFECYDILGRKINSLFRKHELAGSYAIPISSLVKNTGMYILRYTVGSGTKAFVFKR